MESSSFFRKEGSERKEMSDAYKSFLSGSKNPREAVNKIKYDRHFSKEHPEYFHPDGFICFTGAQGSGKSLSAIQYIHKLVKRYPDVILVANCKVQFPDWKGNVIRYTGYEQIAKLDNGYKGIILFLDEIQSEFNSLESKKIDPSWFTVISQQRKRRLHVVGTAQLFSRISKAWREQFTACIACRGWFDLIQWNRVISLDDIEEDENGNITSERASSSHIWFRSPELYDYYDTWERVARRESANNDNRRRKPGIAAAY